MFIFIDCYHQWDQMLEKKVGQFFPKSYPHPFSLQKYVLQSSPKSHQIFLLLLYGNLYLGTFKNRPIRSHWSNKSQVGRQYNNQSIIKEILAKMIWQAINGTRNCQRPLLQKASLFVLQVGNSVSTIVLFLTLSLCVIQLINDRRHVNEDTTRAKKKNQDSVCKSKC